MSVLNALYALVEDDTLPDEDREQAAKQFIAKLAATVPEEHRLRVMMELISDEEELLLIRGRAAQFIANQLHAEHCNELGTPA